MLIGVTRPRMLVPALAIAALLAAAPPAPAAIAPLPPSANIDVEIDLPANNGLRASVANDGEEIALELQRGGYSVIYEVPGEVTETGLKARFGKLGEIEAAFTPTETSKSKPPKGCKGEPSTFSEGLFTGTIRFRGERNYVRIEATQAEGTMEISREPEWRCSSDGRPARPPSAQRSSAPFAGELPKPKREAASLIVAKRGCVCFFGALTVRDESGESVAFIGARYEERERMEIGRGLSVLARPGRFLFDLDDGTATVDPPRPFTGTATYERRPGRDLWQSTIRVPLLGAPPLQVRGNSTAKLVHETRGGR
jgi:hypothetical protein